MIKVWIARDSDGSLYCYNGEPLLCGSFFVPDPSYGECFMLLKDSYPEVTFKNSPLPLEVLFN